MDKKYSLSLCMVVKNEAANLNTLWQSVKHIVDEWIVVDTGSTDGTVETAKRLGAKVYEEGNRFTTELTAEHCAFFNSYGISVSQGQRIFEFSKARNFSFECATKDFILWLDGDDLLVGSRKLQTLIDDHLDPKKQLGLHLLYKYEVDQYGNSIVEHYRERVFPNNKTFKWQGRIHEIIIPTIETQYIRIAPNDVHVLHNVTSDRRLSSGVRNLNNLLLDLYDQGDNHDPRTLFYLAEGLKASNEVKAMELYQEYTKLSGWDEELHIAASRMTDLYLKQGNTSKALDWAFKSVQYKPDFPGGYSNVAEVYYAQDKYQESELFCKQALDLDQPETLVAINEKHNKFTPFMLLTDIYFKKGMFKECLQTVEEALKLEPQNEFLQTIKETCNKVLLEEDIAANYKNIYDYLIALGEQIKARELFRSLPVTHLEDPRLVQLARDAQKIIRSDFSVNNMDDNTLKLIARTLKSRGAKTVQYAGVDPKSVHVLNKVGFESVKNDSDIADAVVVHEQIDRIENIPEFVGHIIKYVKPTGIIAFTTNIEPKDRIRLFDTELLKKILEASGLTVWNCFRLPSGSIFCECLPGKIKSKGSVAFICGVSTEEWGPMSIYSGVGGSEEATIYLTKELALLGHEVSVFNTTPEQCTFEGVNYKNHATLNDMKEYDTAILWRVPHLLDDYKFKAKRTFLWMHDVPEEYWFTKERLEKIEKIIVLSKYHRNLLPAVPDSMFIISQNGVEISQFKEKVDRKKNKVIYTSSYDRGLEHLLTMWPEVRKEVSDAELHIFYGWGTYDKLRTEDRHREWKAKMMEMMKQPGVVDHGRIGQPELAKELLSSDIYAYPCHFEEISCISAMKAQVAGCIPLTTDYAALAETNLSNYKISGNPKSSKEAYTNFLNTFISLLKSKDVDRKEIQNKAKEKFSWKSVAKQWSEFMTIPYQV